MPFNSEITRTDAGALIPEDAARDIIKETADSNWIFQLARRLPDMSRKQRRMPVANALATAYFVNGDTGLKQTTELDWTNKYVDAEEVAAIVPVPEAVLDDEDYDIWGEVKPALVAAFNKAIVQAVLYGTNIPATWTTNLGAAGLVALATADSTVASIAAFTDLYEAIMGESAAGSADGLLMLLEAQGYAVTGHLAHMTMKGRLRNCRSVDGVPVFTGSPVSGAPAELDGAPILFPVDGSLDSSQALDICGQWNQLVYGIRQDMTYKVLSEAVITDAGGNIIYNLAQMDMIAIRAVMRLGFALPNPITPMATGATRCPFSVLTA